MENSNELRLGNIVKIDNPEYHPTLKDIPFMVNSIQVVSGYKEGNTHAIGLVHINQEPNKYYQAYNQFMKFVSPIPLDEDVLIKCGFKQGNDRWYKLGDSPIGVFEDMESICYWDWEFPTRFKYIHQLQNLFFALTGKEINIQL